MSQALLTPVDRNQGETTEQGKEDYSSPPVWCDLRLWEASLSLYASLPEFHKGKSGTHKVSMVGDLLGNPILIHCPNKVAKNIICKALTNEMKSYLVF